MRKANATGYFPYTPSLPLLYGLRESLAMLFEEGLENVFARHHRLAEGTRQAVKAWGLELCARAPKWNSDTVSAIMVPAGINGAEVIDVAYRRYNLALGAGLARMAGKLFRIGHLGDLNELMLAAAASPAPRWRCATSASRSRRGAASPRPQSTGGAPRRRCPSESCRPGRPMPSRRRRCQGKGDRRRRPMSHTRYEPARAAAAAERARRSGLAAGDVPEGARGRGGLRLPRSGGRGRPGRQGAGPAAT